MKTRKKERTMTLARIKDLMVNLGMTYPSEINKAEGEELIIEYLEVMFEGLPPPEEVILTKKEKEYLQKLLVKATKPKTTQLLIWDVPEDTKREFKKSCVDKGVSMRETIINFMEQFIND